MKQMRDYERIAALLRPSAEREAAMQSVVDALWDGLHSDGISWVGFYTLDAAADQMTLGPRRDKPACSPIGLHGVCGQCCRGGRAIVVRDVRELGENYVACDPRDRSEVVVPLFDERGGCWGVLDLDSHDVGAFDDHDVAGLERVLSRAGFRTRP